jgi:HlyD family secretion protein
MDIQRTPPPRRRKRSVIAAAVIILIVLATVALAQLRPAAVPVSRASIMTDVVKRGTLLRSVRGSGRLVPEASRWLAASTDARVEKVLVQPGTRVTAETIIIELSDPQQQQQALDAQWQLRAAEADYESLKASLEVERLNQQAANAQLRAEVENARLRAESDERMAKEGIVADLTRRQSSTNSESLQYRFELDTHRLRVTNETLQSRLAAQKATVEQRRALYMLRQNQLNSLGVRAGIDGVLQDIAVEVGQRVASGSTLARVVQPEKLKAEIRVPEARARDLAVGQSATIDTYNGKVAGVISRIDPAAREGAVTVDISITAPLPAGARPDLSVEAVIELGRLTNAMSVARPAGVQDKSSGHVFKLVDGGKAAERISVSFGQSSADAIEITQGLTAGDEIIVSDTSAWQKYEKIEIK